MDTLRVLVVDDELGMREGARRVLERLTVRLPDVDDHEVRFEVEDATSGEAALARLAASPPDILLLDHKLPGLSGLDVLGRLPAVAPQVLTVMITAYATLETAILATKRGAFDFLAKPFTPEELRAIAVKATRTVTLQRRAREHAAEKRRIRFEFVSVLAHELKAPIAAVEGYLQNLQDGALGPELAPYAPLLDRSLVRLRGMRKLILDLLDLTHLESGQRPRALEPLDLRGLAGGVLEGLRPQADAERVALELRPGGPVRLVGDRLELELVVSNLLTNAVKYNREGGRAVLAVEARGGRAVVRVEDTGIGIDPADLPRLFRDFERVKSERTRHIPGSGLGLSMVRRVAQLYGGDARIESTPGLGTAVEVVLGEVVGP